MGKKDISIENLNEALNQKKCRNKSLRKFNFILQNVIITHVIMIVNRIMASKNRDLAKYKKYIFFFNSHSRFEISMKKYLENNIPSYITLQKCLQLDFQHFGIKRTAISEFSFFFNFVFISLIFKGFRKNMKGFPGM